jgi:hypothetical protein
MRGLPSKEIVDIIRKQYPIRARVKLVHMDDPYSKLTPGAEGMVSHVDDIGTVHVNWDNGSRLGVVYEEDKIEKI